MMMYSFILSTMIQEAKRPHWASITLELNLGHALRFHKTRNQGKGDPLAKQKLSHLSKRRKNRKNWRKIFTTKKTRRLSNFRRVEEERDLPSVLWPMTNKWLHPSLIPSHARRYPRMVDQTRRQNAREDLESQLEWLKPRVFNASY